MLETPCRRLIALALLVPALLLGPPASAGQKPEPKLEEGTWITVSSADLAAVRGAFPARAELAAIAETASHRGLSVALVGEKELVALSQAMHEKFHRCGGFVAHDSQAEALETLYAPPVSTDNLAVTYTIDNGPVARALVAEVSATNIVSTINLLAGNSNRYYTATGGVNAANQLLSRWSGYAGGRTDVTVSLHRHAAWSQPSVVATIQGRTLPNEIVILGGHLDSINSSSPATGMAPGADDDASGIASLTEAFRTLMAKGYRPNRTVKFIAYAAEEVGLRGSKEIAAQHKQQGANIVGVLQLDMTNFKGSTVDMAFLTDFTNAALTTFARNLVTTYLTGVTHTTTACGYGCSDHASWHQQGYPASMPAEAIFGQHNRRIHTSSDTLANSGPTGSHAAKFARLAAAFVAELGKGGFL